MAKKNIVLIITLTFSAWANAQWSGNDNQSSAPANNPSKNLASNSEGFTRNSIGITLLNSFTRKYQNAIDESTRQSFSGTGLDYNNTGLGAFEVEALWGNPILKTDNPLYLIYGYSMGFGWVDGEVKSLGTSLLTFDNFMSAYDLHLGIQKAFVSSEYFQFKIGAGTSIGYFNNEMTVKDMSYNNNKNSVDEILLKPNVNIGIDVSKVYLRLQYNVPIYVLDEAAHEIDSYGSIAVGFGF